MKHAMIIITVLIGATQLMAAPMIPHPPDVEVIAGMVTRPSGEGNAADFYLKAEKLYRDTELSKAPEERSFLNEDSEIYRLLEQGSACASCVFPYSAGMKIPPYEQMIPMMALYNAAAKTYSRNGDTALEAKQYDKAFQWYSKAVNLGLHLWYEPGITVIQDMITFNCLAQGVQGLGDYYIAKGDGDHAAKCARFLAEKTEYLDSIPKFVKGTLARPHKLTQDYRDLADLFPSIEYLPVKLEILLYTMELRVFVQDDEVMKLSSRIIESGMKHPDSRIRAVAEWARDVNAKKMRKMLEQGDDSVFD